MIDCRPFVEQCAGKPIAVFGLGLSGLSTVKALVKAGAEVKAWDDNEKARTAAQEAGAKLVELNEESLKDCALLVLAPGVPLTFPEPHPVVKAAQAHELEIICDLEVLHRCNHGCLTIGITGTNGKSTTTALIHHVLLESGKSAVMGGNIGEAALSMSLPKKDGIIVLELSSYQLDLCPTFRPDIAVLLNITPDHIDRHGSFKNYIDSKVRIFEYEGEQDGIAIIGIDDEPCQKIHDRLIAFELGKRVTRPVSCSAAVEDGVFVEDGVLFDTRDGQHEERQSLKGLTALRGMHNFQNAAAAYAVCASRFINLSVDEIFDAIRTFPGLPHRQKQVRVIDGVPYIDDSKATNAEAASKAISAYEKIYWIAGGIAKESGLKEVQPVLSNIHHAYLIGEAMNEFASWLDQYSIPYSLCGDMGKAVEQAHEHVQNERGQPGANGVVLLSPACASFDQYASFEKRGQHFQELVMALPDNKGEVAA